jgi:molecular chaperone GrpE
VTDQSRPTGVDKPAADPPVNGGPAAAGGKNASTGPERVVIKDKRKVKLATKQAEADKPAKDAAEAAPEAAVEGSAAAAQEPSAAAVPEDPAPAEVVPGALGAELESLRAEIDERTRDLQRLSAEYANYRKRVDRDRALVVEQATGSVLGTLLPVLDDVDRARDHDDLVGPFAAVAEQLVNALTKFGLTAFGVKGDPFDPTRHEAVVHLTSTEVTEPTCVEVMRRGYLLGERLLRPALVAVADPAEPEPPRAAEEE